MVYQKDLGKKTDVLAQAMREYDCSPGWQKTDEQEEAPLEQKVKYPHVIKEQRFR